MKFRIQNLPIYVIIVLNCGNGIPHITGTMNCEGFGECVIFAGYTCKNNKCVCDPEPGLFRCIPAKFYGERCDSDQECKLGDFNLQCLKSDIRICKCKRGYVWDLERKKCISTLDNDMYNGKFEPVRDLIIPGLIIMTIGAMVYLGFKLFCNCGKLWGRRHQEMARELQEISAAPHQQAWIASYRMFSPYSNSNRPSSALSPTAFSLHSTPCMGLFVPSQSLSQCPPPYEEALKHKVVLSSYQGNGRSAVSAYALTAPEVSRQYPSNASSPSAIILNPNVQTLPPLKVSSIPTNSRPYPIAQGDPYGMPPLSNDWAQLQYAGNVNQIWASRGMLPQPCRVQDFAHSEASGHNSRAPQLEVWPPHQTNSQFTITQPHSGVYRSVQPQKIHRGIDDLTTTSRSNRRNN